MRLLVILVFFVSLCVGKNLPILAEEVASIYCPYASLSGIGSLCASSHRYPSMKGHNQPPTFPALLGVGWDPVLGQIRLPFLRMTYTQSFNVSTPMSTVFSIPDQLIIEVINSSSVTTATYTSMNDYLNATDLSRDSITSGNP